MHAIVFHQGISSTFINVFIKVSLVETLAFVQVVTSTRHSHVSYASYLAFLLQGFGHHYRSLS